MPAPQPIERRCELYRGELTEVEMHHVTGARQATDEHGAFTTPVTVHLNDGVEVEGTVELTPGTRWRRQQYNVNGDGRLACSCGDDPCEARTRRPRLEHHR